MAKGSESQSAICDSNELGREKAGGKVKQPWLPSLGRSEEEAEGVSGRKVGEFIGCSHGAGNHHQPFAPCEYLKNRTHR